MWTSTAARVNKCLLNWRRNKWIFEGKTEYFGEKIICKPNRLTKMHPQRLKTAIRAMMCHLSVILVLLIESGLAFNISPHPNIVVREPINNKLLMPKMRSSYFGFSINLKRDRWVSDDTIRRGSTSTVFFSSLFKFKSLTQIVEVVLSVCEVATGFTQSPARTLQWKSNSSNQSELRLAAHAFRLWSQTGWTTYHIIVS